MRWGGELEHLENLAARGISVKALESRPTLFEGIVWVWDAYATLSSCRSYTMGGAGSIPWTAVKQYAESEEIPHFDTFWKLIQRMDETFLSTGRELSKTRSQAK